MRRAGLIIAIGLAVMYAVGWSWFSIGRHWKTNSTRFDLGNAEQVVWNGSQGRWFESTDPYGTETVTRLAYHADFFLMALVPIYGLAPYTETLLILQALGLASAILAVFLLARHWLKHDGWAVVFAIIFAIQPSLHWINAYDFHAVALAVPLILWTAYAMMKRRYTWMIVLAGLAMLTKEEIGFTLIPLALYVWLIQKHRGWGIAMLLPSIWALLMFFIAIPAAQSAVEAENVFRSSLGNSAVDVLRNSIAHPRHVLSLVTSQQTLTYMQQVLLPFGWLPFGHWLTASGLPDLTINVLSGKASQQTIYFQYMAGIIPGIMLGLLWLVRRVRIRWAMQKVQIALAVWIGGWALVGAWLYGPLPGARQDYSRVVRWQNVNAEPVRIWASRIPSDAAVTVTNNIGAHFARRQHFYSFPLGIEQSDYAVVLQGYQHPEVVDQSAVDASVLLLRADPAWEQLERIGGLWIFRRS